MTFWLHPFQPATGAADLRNRFQQGIGFFRLHRIELFGPGLAVECFDGPQVRIQHVNQAMKLFVGQFGVHIIGGVYAEGKRDGFTPVQRFEPLFNVRGIADLDIFRKAGIGQDIDDTFLAHGLFSCNVGKKVCF